jgi:hypothetical protein
MAVNCFTDLFQRHALFLFGVPPSGGSGKPHD